MIAAAALHDVAYAALLERGDAVGELLHDHAGLKAVAVRVIGQARVLAVLVHHLVEQGLALGLRHGAQLADQLVGLFQLGGHLLFRELVALVVGVSEQDVLGRHKAVLVGKGHNLLVGELLAVLAVHLDKHARIEHHHAVYVLVYLRGDVDGCEIVIKLLFGAVLADERIYVALQLLVEHLLVVLGQLDAVRSGLLVENPVLDAEVFNVLPEIFADGHNAVEHNVHRHAAHVLHILAVEPVEILVPRHVLAVHAEDYRVGRVVGIGRSPVVLDVGGGGRARARAGARVRRRRFAAGRERSYEHKGAQGACKKLFHHLSPSLLEVLSVLCQSSMKAAASSSTRDLCASLRARTGFFDASTLSLPLYLLRE